MPTETYLVANFKETQIDEMRPGARAEVKIDAYPGRSFEAQVDSLAGGTGSRFRRSTAWPAAPARGSR